MRPPRTEAGGLRPPPSHIPPEFTPDLRVFWIDQLRGLTDHHRAVMLTALANRYGEAAAAEVRQAVPA
ncbi:hypothetical protein L1280_002810 [Deinococcus sp. HSC-46F16]|uniref:hypothetical protein n=1 Tax=Deinococcus sp. HSC-46F16 TaxID=2910968 RepID=UPI0020A13253|nr:hypothetical protein [Deinococcus sp. HSC-46F16]MCP2015642.1 hypothetical protein [Deinococcus sp. HSC-46F16]